MNKRDLLNKLDEYVETLKYEEKAKRTYVKYKKDALMFINHVNHNQDITKDDTLAFKQYLLERSYKPSTINSYIISVNKYLYYCGIENVKVKKAKSQQKTSIESVINISDYNRLLRFARRLGYEDIRLIMKIFKTTGVRYDGLKYFTVEKVNENFYIEAKMKGKNIDIIMTQELAREIRSYCKKYEIKSGEIFNISYATLWRRMKKIAGAAKVNKAKVHPHSFRHLFAKECIRNGMSEGELADILGHESIETTRIYTKSSKEEKRKMLERMT